MKIAYAASSIIPSKAANSIQVMKMCNAFVQSGHELALYTPSHPSHEIDVKDIHNHYGMASDFEINKIPYLHPQGSPWKNALSAGLYTVKSALRFLAFKPDLVYGRSLEACHTATSLGIPTIFEAHDLLDHSRIARILFRRMHQSKSLLHTVVISQKLKELICNHWHLDHSKVVVAHDAADPVPNEMAATWPGRPDVLQVGYVGSIYKGRGIGLILTLAAHFPDIDFHFIGGNRNDLTDNHLTPGPNVHFHGSLPYDDATRRRMRCDVLLAPYQRKVEVSNGGNTVDYMSPLKIFEYMASGRPFICSDLPVLREVLDDTIAGLVPPDDIEAWKNMLSSLQSPGERAKLAQAALERFKKHHTWNARVKQVLSPASDFFQKAESRGVL